MVERSKTVNFNKLLDNLAFLVSDVAAFNKLKG